MAALLPLIATTICQKWTEQIARSLYRLATGSLCENIKALPHPRLQLILNSVVDPTKGVVKTIDN